MPVNARAVYEAFRDASNFHVPLCSVPAKDSETGRFLPGNNGGAGRPVGSRNKLGEAFVADMLADWEANGASAIRAVRESDPSVYLRVIASVLPKHVGLETGRDTFADLTEQELRALIRTLLEGVDLSDETGHG